MSDDLHPRVTALERLQAQQDRLNALLIDVTARLGAEHALYADALALHDARQAQQTAELARHAEHMARLDALLVAIKDLLDRGNSH